MTLGVPTHPSGSQRRKHRQTYIWPLLALCGARNEVLCLNGYPLLGLRRKELTHLLYGPPIQKDTHRASTTYLFSEGNQKGWNTCSTCLEPPGNIGFGKFFHCCSPTGMMRKTSIGKLRVLNDTRVIYAHSFFMIVRAVKRSTGGITTRTGYQRCVCVCVRAHLQRYYQEHVQTLPLAVLYVL